MFLILRVFRFELLLSDAFFTPVKHGVPDEDEVPLIGVHAL